MTLTTAAILVAAGLGGGLIAGLVGLGGGVIFAPVLFFFFQEIGVAAELVTPMTVGTSLFCTLLAAAISAVSHARRGAVETRMAVVVGLCSAVAILAVSLGVTTQPWYDQQAFQIVFSGVLLIVVARMLLGRRPAAEDEDEPKAGRQTSAPWLVATGSAAGSVAAAAGVGGGVVLVPAYNRFLKLPMHRAAATSSATIVLIALAGVLTYAVRGWGVAAPGWGVGYVDVSHGLLLAGPALLTAQWGVTLAHRVNRRLLQYAFSAIAVIVAARMIVNALF